VYEFLLPISLVDLAATLEDFTPVERRVIPL
jgi:hypothetical protein